jgi:hypothetical protein
MEIKLNLSKEQLRTLSSIAFKYVNIGGFRGDPGVEMSIQMAPIYEILSLYCSKAHSECYDEQEYDSDAPKTVWLAYNAYRIINQTPNLPIFTSKEKCLAFCHKENEHILNMFQHLEPAKIIVDKFSKYVRERSNDEQK